MTAEQEEYRQSFRRLFEGRNLSETYCRFDGHTARNSYLLQGWNFAIEQGWLKVVEVNLEQETFSKGYLTEKGQQEVLGG